MECCLQRRGEEQDTARQPVVKAGLAVFRPMDTMTFPGNPEDPTMLQTELGY
jgi:hypothetical protein